MRNISVEDYINWFRSLKYIIVYFSSIVFTVPVLVRGCGRRIKNKHRDHHYHAILFKDLIYFATNQLWKQPSQKKRKPPSPLSLTGEGEGFLLQAFLHCVTISYSWCFISGVSSAVGKGSQFRLMDHYLQPRNSNLENLWLMIRPNVRGDHEFGMFY